ncbi:toll/interleukin-1 receptor domain-containing protein [Bizionia myxarmorum]|uniref:TIR domain-containing protein n=1 Tax=Bizionia myxarmorum TaxID=291186 RepID=A0A5D0R6W0_9FLAO|nr:toll/interleukin-1 receptor domain-containing protein [Bizionia myxarmorum]TYB76294.1 TIR domain-containing protein [Bizionia myxarmorum]
MNALNRYYWPTKYESRDSFINQNVKCVFISYQNNDKNEAKKIADYLISAGINVYFDEYDGDLKRTNQSSQPNKVTDSLCKGINNSTHMLVVVSPTTIISKWVPFEIGYGYDKTDIAVLCLKGIPKNTLPEYIRTSKVIRDIYDLNTEISNIKGVPKDLLLENFTIRKHNYSYHDLKNVMDEIIT